jgi:outer membrane protein, multidrug efflux system
MNRTRSILLILLAPSLCFAQTPGVPTAAPTALLPAAPPAITPPVAPLPAPGTAPLPNTAPAAAGTAPGAGGSLTDAPRLPEVNDPMLAAPAGPAHVLQSWREALQLVRSRSTSLGAAESQVDSASARARAALSQAYPTLTASGRTQRHLLFGTGTNITGEGAQINVRIPDPATVWSAGLSLRHPLLAPRAWHDTETANVAVRAAQSRVQNTERLVLAEVADAIVLVVTAERLAEVSRIALHSSLSTLDLTQRRARLGAGSAVDVLRAEQEVTLNRAQLLNSDEALQRSREALGMALGFPEAWGVTPNVKLDALALDAQRVCSPLKDLGQRADVRAAKVDVTVAERQAQANNWALSPTLDLVSDLTYSTASFTANGIPTQWTVGALLTIPLYDGGSRVAERGIAVAEAERVRSVLTQTERGATLEVVQAMRAVQVAEQNLEVSRKLRDLSQETSRLAQLSYVNGRSTSFELVDAARRYQQAELDLTVKEFEVVRARIIALLAKANCDV